MQPFIPINKPEYLYNINNIHSLATLATPCYLEYINTYKKDFEWQHMKHQHEIMQLRVTLTGNYVWTRFVWRILTTKWCMDLATGKFSKYVAYCIASCSCAPVKTKIIHTIATFGIKAELEYSTVSSYITIKIQQACLRKIVRMILDMELYVWMQKHENHFKPQIAIFFSLSCVICNKNKTHIDFTQFYHKSKLYRSFCFSPSGGIVSGDHEWTEVSSLCWRQFTHSRAHRVSTPYYLQCSFLFRSFIKFHMFDFSGYDF